MWHSSQEEQFQRHHRVLQHTGFPIFSNSNPLKHFFLETKYCELKPDDRLEYQIYLVSFSEAAEVSSSGSADHKRDVFEVGGLFSCPVCTIHVWSGWCPRDLKGKKMHAQLRQIFRIQNKI